MEKRWEFWIDVGGTFTDCIAQAPDGQLLRHKTLSSGVIKGTVGEGSTTDVTDPLRRGDPVDFWRDWQFDLIDAQGNRQTGARVEQFDATRGSFQFATPLDREPQHGDHYELHCDLEAPQVAIQYLLQKPLKAALPPLRIRLGTTRGTNALLTRSGKPTAFVTTRGFGDILRIGYQARPQLFDLNIRKPTPLFTTALEIDERVAPTGEILSTLNVEQWRSSFVALRDKGIESLAICLLNAYANGSHEDQLAELAAEVGFSEISVSNRVAPLIKLVSRGDTTVVNAYLNSVLKSYLSRIADSESDSHRLQIMTSSGGLVGVDAFEGKDSILSGPAGGVVGFARVAEAVGYRRAIGFDMGGTSTDVARYDGSFEREYETEKAGVRIVTPMLAIETVAAGGGSICGFDGVKLAVGPASAGADPGPACYGKGGPLTITDMNLHLGKIPTEQFPFPLDPESVSRQLNELTKKIERQPSDGMSTEELAEGFLRVANANMAQAIRSISIAKGYDPRDYILVSFGGAAPQHACAVARELGITTIVNHPDGGILSALGVGHADLTRHAARGIYQPLDANDTDDLTKIFEELETQTHQEIINEGLDAASIGSTRSLDLRYLGTDAALTISQPDDGNFERAFTDLHRVRYGYVHADRPLEIVAARVESVGRSTLTLPDSKPQSPQVRASQQTRSMYLNGSWVESGIFHRDELQPGDRIEGPAMIVEHVSTTIVDPDWTADVLSGGELLFTDQATRKNDHHSTESDPVLLEIFNRNFAGIAEQMGITLRNTSSSVNVKERLDFSCAIFTSDGDLVVNAPHIPVHLGAMSETVRCVLEDHPELAPGDVIITNDPYRGGSHLPDVTVITPIHDDHDGQLRFLVASRAHHAEIGGITPGSMPPFSHTLAEEGVLLESFKLVDGGESRFDELESRLKTAPYPSRNVAANLADIRAQVAANHQGVGDLQGLIERYTWPVVAAYMKHIQGAAETKVRSALLQLDDGDFEFEDHLDNGAVIRVRISIEGDTAKIDFRDSAAQTDDNLNANRAIVAAATMYCLRCLINEDIPLNQGVMSPVELIVEPGILNPHRGKDAAHCAAVAGGNVETSQRVVDVLLGAFGLAAASQGTMNNLLFGNDQFGYYETICGGAGATREQAGADAVHTHMTNTRLTDPEVIERQFPIRLARFEIRQESGGRGRNAGGNGVVRELEFLSDLEVSILSQRRGTYAPYGCQGGEPGTLGQNRLHQNGEWQELPWRAQFSVRPGDRLVIETPGGGGFGRPDQAET